MQIANLAKISSWKVFKFAGQYCESTDPLIKLFSSLKLDVLENLELHINCIVDLHQIFEVVIGKLGENLEQLTLRCDYCDLGCEKKCQYEETLTLAQLERIMTKCSKLKKLEINGTKLPDQYLCQIESKTNFRLIVDPLKAKTMKRFKMMITKIL